jgi:hypothetical protein
LGYKQKSTRFKVYFGALLALASMLVVAFEQRRIHRPHLLLHTFQLEFGLVQLVARTRSICLDFLALCSSTFGQIFATKLSKALGFTLEM